MAWLTVAESLRFFDRIPLLTFAMSVYAGLEPPLRPRATRHVPFWRTVGCVKLLGLLISLGGAVFAVGSAIARKAKQDKEDHGADGASMASVVVAYFYVLIQVSMSGVYVISQKRLLERGHDALQLSAWVGLVGGVLVFLGVLPSGVLTRPGDDTWRAIDGGAVGALAYAILVVSAGNYFLYSWANERTNPLIVNAFMTLQPFAAAALGHILLPSKNPFAWTDGVGGGFIVLGLFLLIGAKAHEWRRETAAAAGKLRAKEDGRDGDEENWHRLSGDAEEASAGLLEDAAAEPKRED